MRLYFWIDDLGQIESCLSKLERTAEKYSLAPFRAVALGLRGRYMIRTGRIVEGIACLRGSLEKLTVQRFEILLTDFVFELAVNLAKMSARAEALALVDEWIVTQVQANRPLHLPQLFLAKGLVIASGDLPEIRSAEACFEKAMMLARQDAARPFELRAGLELARIWIDRGELRKARDLIGPIYGRFTEGLATPDLVLARRILEQTSVRAMQTGRRAAKSSGRAWTDSCQYDK
jgi:tetratricopeptide (TPR) repeat protein